MWNAKEKNLEVRVLEPLRETPGRSKKPIIAIDDDDSFRQMLQLSLGLIYDLKCCPSGKDLIDLLQEHRPLLILLDVQLPEVNGFNLCQVIRTQPSFRQTPILMLTARGDNSSFVQALNAGADAYLSKPFEIRDLLGRISYLLSR